MKLVFYTIPIGNRTPGCHVAVHYATAAPRQLLLTVGAKLSVKIVQTETNGSFHAKSPKIRKISRGNHLRFWWKLAQMLIYIYDGHMQKVLSSGDKFDFYSHIYKGGGVFPISYSRCRIWMIACFKMISFVFFKLSKWKFILYQIVIWEIEFWHHFVSICDTVENMAN